MAYRPLEISLISAKDLRDVNIIFKMDVYVVASITTDPRSVERTQIHKNGGTNPKWKYKMQFAIDETAAQHNETALVFQLISRRVFGDRTIGIVYISLKDLLNEYNPPDHCTSSGDGPRRSVCYQVTTVSGKPRGTLSFSYRIGEAFMVSSIPTEGHHLHPATQGGAAAAPYHPQGYTYPVHVGYPYLPVGNHGYGPATGNVEEPPVVNRSPEKKSKFGSAIGVGMGAGFLGSLLADRKQDDCCNCCGIW